MNNWIAAGAGGAGIVVAAGIALVVAGGRPAPDGPHVTSMAQGGAAMAAAADVMLRHAGAMRADGERTGDPVLLAHARHWTDDAAQVAQRAAWMAQDPAALAGLATGPAALAPQGNLAALTRGAGAMVHSVERLAGARDVDLNALRWNGESMRDEGRLMGEHARAMAADIDQMAAHHGLSAGEAAALREAVAAMAAAAEHTRHNGQAMLDYAARTERSLGRR